MPRQPLRGGMPPESVTCRSCPSSAAELRGVPHLARRCQLLPSVPSASFGSTRLDPLESGHRRLPRHLGKLGQPLSIQDCSRHGQAWKCVGARHDHDPCALRAIPCSHPSRARRRVAPDQERRREAGRRGCRDRQKDLVALFEGTRLGGGRSQSLAQRQRLPVLRQPTGSTGLQRPRHHKPAPRE